MRGSRWTLEMDCLLRDYITRDKLSARGAAARLGMSRGSVIGRANRIGLKLNNFAAVAYSVNPRPPKPVPIPVELPPIDAPISLNMTIESLRDGNCRFPYGKLPPYDYCGQPVKSHSPWCNFHASVCVVPAKTRSA